MEQIEPSGGQYLFHKFTRSSFMFVITLKCVLYRCLQIHQLCGYNLRVGKMSWTITLMGKAWLGEARAALDADAQLTAFCYSAIFHQLVSPTATVEDIQVQPFSQSWCQHFVTTTLPAGNLAYLQSRVGPNNSWNCKIWTKQLVGSRFYFTWFRFDNVQMTYSVTVPDWSNNPTLQMIR